TKAATQASVSGVKHVDLTPTEQVSIANAIGHVIERFRNRKVSGVVGFTIDGEEVRFFSGGFLPEEVLVKGALALQAPGLPLVRARDGADPGATLAGLSSILVHTRDK